MAESRRLIILQHNLGKGKAATSELRQHATTVGASVLLIQEPWTRDNTVCGLGPTSNQIIVGTSEVRPRACIVVLERGLDVVVLTHLSNQDCVCIRLTSEFRDTCLVSMYFPPALPQAEFLRRLQHLQDIHDAIGDTPVIVGMDANAKSPAWGADRSDASGRLLEDFISASSWSIANEVGLPTFSSSRGTSHIDVTLLSHRLWPTLDSWRVRQDWTTSDHAVLEIILRAPTTTRLVRSTRFNMKRANWTPFIRDTELALMDAELTLRSPRDVNSLADEVTTAIQQAAAASIPKKTFFPRSVPWWTPELTHWKRRCAAMRRCAQRTRDPVVKDLRRREYRRLRREYTKRIYRAKIASWRTFVTTVGNETPYGLVYKLLRVRIAPETALANLRLAPDVYTSSWADTSMALLDALIPDAPGTPNWTLQQDLARLPFDRSRDTRRWTCNEVICATEKHRKGKAPGHDLIEPGMLHQLAASDIFVAVTTELFNGCLVHGVFPDVWKLGDIRTLLKSAEKDPKEVTSYRPICLLPLLGKTLERLMRLRLHPVIRDPQFASPRQYGFRQGTSTVDAILHVRAIISACAEKYVLGILFDVQAAFDHLWWPALLAELALRHCPLDLATLLVDYLHGRRVRIHGNYQTAGKPVTRGCPQGSILGPDLWNVVMDSLLRRLSAHDVECVAYADDLIVLVAANSRILLETAAQRAVDLVASWCGENHLRLSTQKTEQILLKGILRDRPPLVRLQGTPIRSVPATKYLGVWLGRNMTLSAHIRMVQDKGNRVFTAFSKLAATEWGLTCPTLGTYYRAIFLPMASYAVGAWGDRIDVRSTRQITTAQRQILLRITKAYRTASTPALQVVAGVLPLDLELQLAYLIHRFKQGQRQLAGMDLTACSSPREASRRLHNHFVAEWQRRWDRAAEGRTTYAFLPNVNRRLKSTWLVADHWTTQFLTGHGDFASYLHARSLRDSPLCTCGGIDTPWHIVMELSLIHI